jgi:hypothetical protein
VTPGIIGKNPRRWVIFDEVKASAPMVRPWKPP